MQAPGGDVLVRVSTTASDDPFAHLHLARDVAGVTAAAAGV
eukprot:gene5895-62314_t